MLATVDFFGSQISRLILGDNPFNGHSYIVYVCLYINNFNRLVIIPLY
jgi:hypothetical protein